MRNCSHSLVGGPLPAERATFNRLKRSRHGFINGVDNQRKIVALIYLADKVGVCAIMKGDEAKAGIRGRSRSVDAIPECDAEGNRGAAF